MPCQISVTDEDVRYLTQQAQEELVSLGEAYAR